jgi:hypothetical protein
MSRSQRRALKLAFENFATEMSNFSITVHNRDAQRKVQKSCAGVRNSIRRMLHGPNKLSAAEKVFLERMVDQTSKIRVGLTRYAAGSGVLTNQHMAYLRFSLQPL